MMKNPIRQAAEALGFSINKLSWTIDVSQSYLSQVFTGKAPMTSRVAAQLEDALHTNRLPILIANALWRQSEGFTVNKSEETMIAIGEKIIGLNSDQLTVLMRHGLGYVRHAIDTQTSNEAPGVVLDQGKGKQDRTTANKRNADPNEIPAAPGILFPGGE